MPFLKPATSLVIAFGLLAGLGGTDPTPPGRWSWPLSPKPAVLRTFDPPDKPWLSGHRGVDLGPAPDGGPVTAPSDGVVTFAAVVVDRPVLTIDQGDGLKSSFEPVISALKEGDHVVKGQTIGNVQPGHCGSTTCLHWGVRRDGEYVNPLGFAADLRPSVLLPLD